MKYLKKNTVNFWPVVFIIILILLIQKLISNQNTVVEEGAAEMITNKETPVYLEVNEGEEVGQIPSEDTIFEEGEEVLDFDIHIVQSGENLSSIAEEWGVTVTAIMRINEIENPDSIKIGQELKIPLRDQWNSDYPEDKGLYRVKKGDSLWGIAKMLDTTIDILLELNPDLDPAKLKIGQMINIPSSSTEENQSSN